MYTNWDAIRRWNEAAARAAANHTQPERRFPLPYEDGDNWNPEALPVLDSAPAGFTRVQYWTRHDDARPTVGRYYALRHGAIEEYVRTK